MESNSTSVPSPAWPTRWPRNSFRPGPTLLLIVAIVGAAFFAEILTGMVLFLTHTYTMAQLTTDPIALVTGQSAIDIAVIAVVLPMLPWASRFSLPALGFRAPNGRAVGIALLGTLVAFVLSTVIGSSTETLLHQHHPEQVVKIFIGLHDPVKRVIFVVLAAVVAPVFEELVFRVVLFNVGLRYAGFWIGALISALLFGFAHGDPLLAPALAAVGFALAGVYYYSRNAYASMISHALFNLTSVVALLINPNLANS